MKTIQSTKREIKFRAWDKIQNLMWEVPALSFIKQKAWIIHPVVGEAALDFKDIELMQYTGLKDKNGTGQEVYEGDIVRYGHTSKCKACGEVKDQPTDVIIWKNGAWHFEKAGGEVWAYTNLEILGNIYENPELID